MSNQPTEVVGCLAASFAKTGRVEEAQKCLEEFHLRSRQELAYYPEDNPERWREHWYRSFPFKDEDNLDNLLEGLRQAGLPV